MAARAYIRVIVDLVDRKARVGYTSDQIVAFLQTLLKGALQPDPGHYANVAVLEAWLGRYKRHSRFLQQQSDLVPDDNGGLYIEGWDEIQEGDLTVADRMRRYRERIKAQKTLPLDLPASRNDVRKGRRNSVTAISADAIANADALSKQTSKVSDPDRVFAAWRDSLPKEGQTVEFTDKRRRLVHDRLKRYDVEQLCAAVSIGWQYDAIRWPPRADPGARDLAILLRTDEQAEKFINLAAGPRPTPAMFKPDGPVARLANRRAALRASSQEVPQ